MSIFCRKKAGTLALLSFPAAALVWSLFQLADHFEITSNWLGVYNQLVHISLVANLGIVANNSIGIKHDPNLNMIAKIPKCTIPVSDYQLF